MTSDALKQTVEVPSHPVLERVLWEDRPPNLTVDAGDVLRLVFDRPVTLRRTRTSSVPEVRVPEDLRLVSQTDRLDDGLVPSRFEPGEAPEEILVVLGTRPRLTIDGSLQSPKGRLALRPPSALAINGTRIFPALRIVATRGGWGAISVRAVDIEFAEEKRRWRPVEGEFPWPGHRTDHTVTPLPHGRALIVGGRAIDTDIATAQVLIFDPAALDRGEDLEPEEEINVRNPFQLAADRLPQPASEHTATLLAGPDTIVGTDDDLVVVIGGRDEDQVLGTITVFAIGEYGDPYIPKPPDTPGPALPALELELHVPRWEHTSVAVGPLRVLVDGGRTRGPSGLVGCAELLTFKVHEGGGVTLAVRTTFRSIPRIQHTLSPLPSIPTDKRERYVLAYGGYGQYRLQSAFLAHRDRTLGQILSEVFDADLPSDDDLPSDVYFTDDDFGTVLVSPVLFDLDDPERSVVLKYNFSFPLLRRGHVAVPIGGKEMETTILIAGGTSTHLEQVSRNKQRGWEIDGELIRRLSQNLPITPEGYEAGNAVLFHFDHVEPRRSRFSIVAHPAPDSQMIERLHQAHAVVPGMGVLLLGGEQPEADGQKGLRICDIFLEELRVWLPMAPFLTQPRSGHEAYVVGKDGIPTVFIIGGKPHSAAGDLTFPAVEELRLR